MTRDKSTAQIIRGSFDAFDALDAVFALGDALLGAEADAVPVLLAPVP